LRHLWPVREKCNDVPIFHFRLLESAFRIPGVAEAELRTRYIIRIRITVDQGFQQGSRLSVVGFRHGLLGLSKQPFVRVFDISPGIAASYLRMSGPQSHTEKNV